MAREEGEVSRFGLVMIWASGSTDPSAMLQDQLELARVRLGSILGEELQVRNSLRVLCFGKREAYLAFTRKYANPAAGSDGYYIRTPSRIIVLTEMVAAYRLSDAPSTARSAFCRYFADGYRGFPFRPWLDTGLADIVRRGTDAAWLARHDRKMLASFARNSALRGADFFGATPRVFRQISLNWYNHTNAVALYQFIYQAGSVIKFLAADSAPEERRARFRAFLKAVPRRGNGEVAFERAFGYGYVRLLQEWRAWVEARGMGTHTLPPPDIRRAIRQRVIPTIHDRSARFMDRILAIRELGCAGFAFGADALIELLHGGVKRSREDVVWSLESIAGLALGDDPKAWSSWWDGLPKDAIYEPDQDWDFTEKDVVAL
jgi:hypothetical protein